MRILFVTTALYIGVFPFVYYLLDVKFYIEQAKDPVLANTVWRVLFHVHIITGAVALLTGWLQFVSRLRKKYAAVHRNLGKVYIVCALVSSVAAMYLAFNAEGRPFAPIGFLCLAGVWFYSTLNGWREYPLPAGQQALIFHI